jgi:hypothetical protein
MVDFQKPRSGKYEFINNLRPRNHYLTYREKNCRRGRLRPRQHNLEDIKGFRGREFKKTTRRLHWNKCTELLLGEEFMTGMIAFGGLSPFGISPDSIWSKVTTCQVVGISIYLAQLNVTSMGLLSRLVLKSPAV